MRLRPWLAVLCVCLPLGAPAPRAEEEGTARAARSITVAELREHVYYLASDELEGRGTGEAGYDAAARYAAMQFRAAGLATLLAGEDGRETFLQEFSLVSHVLGDGNSLTVCCGDDEVSLSVGKHYLLLSPGGDPEAVLDFSEPLFVGYGGRSDYEGLDARGRIVLALSGDPPDASHPDPIEAVDRWRRHASLDRGPLAKARTAMEMGAAAAVIVTDAQAVRAWDGWRFELAENRLDLASAVSPAAKVRIPVVVVGPEAADAIFAAGGRHPPQAAEGVRLGLVVDYRLEEIATRNVVAMVPGTDPELSDQYITVGAHLDHLGIEDGQVYNGADDNASGSAAVLEIAEAVAAHPSARPVVFILYAGEELGLFGSRHFVDRCPVPVDEVMVNINLDMIGRYDPRNPESDGIYAVGAARTCPELAGILRAVNERTVRLPLDYSGGDGWFGGSDHFNFHERGIPVVFFTNDEHPDYHQPTDDADRIEYDNLRSIAVLAYWLVMELGDREHALCAGEGGGVR